MSDHAANVARLQEVYRRWNETKGTDTTMWTDLLAPDARLRSLAGGAPGLDFTVECRGAAEYIEFYDTAKILSAGT